MTHTGRGCGLCPVMLFCSGFFVVFAQIHGGFSRKIPWENIKNELVFVFLSWYNKGWNKMIEEDE